MLVKEMTASLMRENRVEMLREQIGAGTYLVDSTELARKLIGL